jgi:hypothetical protein
MIGHGYVRQTRLCRGCGKDWYSEVFLSEEEVPCPDCDIPLIPALGTAPQQVVMQLTRTARRRPGTREQASFN